MVFKKLAYQLCLDSAKAYKQPIKSDIPSILHHTSIFAQPARLKRMSYGLPCPALHG